MLLSSEPRTFCRSWGDGRVNACICSRSASGMVHHGRRRVAHFVPVARAGGGSGGLTVYITQCCGRGAFSPKSTRLVWDAGSVSK